MAEHNTTRHTRVEYLDSTENHDETADLYYRSHYITIDSRDRISGTQNDFVVDLPHTYKGIRSIELLGYEFPLSAYNVNDHNRHIDIDEAGTEKTASIAKGQYDIDQLCTALTALGTGDYTPTATNTYTWSNTSATAPFDQKVTMTRASGAATFGLKNLDGVNNKRNITSDLLGYNRTNTAVDAAAKISDNRFNVSGHNYVYLQVGPNNNVPFKHLESTHVGGENSFAKIALDSTPGAITYKSFRGHRPLLLFPSLHGKLEKLHVKWKHSHVSGFDDNDFLYEHNGLENSFSLDIKCLAP